MKNYIGFDWAMKRLLRNKANYDILEGFLSELLKQDLKIKSIGESEGNQDSATAKYNRVDILAKNDTDDIILIEIQQQRDIHYFHRMVYGTAKAITDHIKVGEKYEKVKKVYSINIVYFDLGQGKDYVYRGITNFKGIHQNDDLYLSVSQRVDKNHAQMPSVIFPEYYVIKVNQFDDIAKDSLDEWIYYFKNNEIKDEFSAKGIEHARTILAEDQMSKKEKKQYEQFLIAKANRESEDYTQRQEGIKEGMKDVAIKMKERGFSISDIADMTGLSKEEIQKL